MTPHDSAAELNTFTLTPLVRELRVAEWTKNLLVFVPLVCAHRFTDGAAWLAAGGAFAALSLAASAQYAVNDVVDAPADRLHPTKQSRPVASGALSPSGALTLAAALGTAALAVAAATGPALLGWVALYLALALIYSLLFKRIAVADVALLAGLYTLRIFAGGAATAILISPWLGLFSATLFLSLALMQRYQDVREPYHAAHARVLAVCGVLSGAAAVLVFALYIHHSGISALYRRPLRLWPLCALWAFWLGRLWHGAWRGAWSGKPLTYVLKDGPSYALLTCALALILLAL
jgi:4-hydroxybenzoate polyprenyltransferase